jgi:hypothetical protein
MIKTPRSVLIAELNRPRIIYVIRERKGPNRSWWNHGKDGDKYYSGFLNENQYIYSFLNRSCAEKCVLFLKDYKRANGRYPDLNGNNKSIGLPDDLQIYVDEEFHWSIRNKCLLNSTGLIGVNNFDYTTLGGKNTFHFEDLLGNEKVDQTHMVEHLNYLLDF